MTVAVLKSSTEFLLSNLFDLRYFRSVLLLKNRRILAPTWFFLVSISTGGMHAQAKAKIKPYGR